MVRMLGADQKTQLIDQPVACFVDPSHQEPCTRLFEEVITASVRQRIESLFVRCNGDPFPVEINAGRFDWNGQPMVQIVVRDITERKLAEETLRQRNRELAVLNRAGQVFSSSLDVQQVLANVLDELCSLLEVTGSSAWLVDAATSELVCWQATGPGSQALCDWRLAPGEGLAGWTCATGEPLLVSDAQADERHNRAIDELTDQTHHAVLTAPLGVKNQTLGVLQLFDTRINRFRQSDLHQVEALAAIATIAVENALLFRATNLQRGQLRALTARLAEVQERERQQLARELHDRIGQNLTTLSLNLNIIEQLLPDSTPPAVSDRLRDSLEVIGEASRRVRDVMAELRPPVLDDYGLLAALRAPIEVTCVDANNDGVVDPISTCTSWDNNSNTTCTDVSQAFPGTNSKCSCSTGTPNPPILIYRGYDFGDLPDTYGTLLASDGARHAIQDTNNDATPDAQGGVPAVWLGPVIDFSPTGETNGQPSAAADGDDLGAPLSDEDGVAFPGQWYTDLPAGGKVTVSVSASDPNACAGNKCYVGYWIDWDGSGTFNPAAYPGGEYYVAPVSVGTNNFTFPVPSTWTSPLYIRFRLYYESTGVQGSYLPTGLSINGEVEDHLSNIVPSAVALASFAATCQADTPVITWETLSEVDTAGFNVWRSDTTGAPETRLNASMIPAHPGSTQGYSYNWTDSTAQVGQIYYYWLEDVDLNGATNLNGPIEAICTSPTAVTVNGLEANGSSGSTAVWWAPLIALIAGIALAGLLSRRSLVK